MYSTISSIRQLSSLMIAHGIQHVVTTPGSRNAPLIQTFYSHPDLTCYSIVDERSAAFFALGLILQLQEPVAICCTSGSALLNLAPAVAEAFYQELPLLVVSADRPASWIGQMDGQTLIQPHVFGALAKHSVSLPEGTTSEDSWHTNRLINEALIALTPYSFSHDRQKVEERTPKRLLFGSGPVHINIPLREPLFALESTLPESTRSICHHSAPRIFDELPLTLKDIWNSTERRVILIGQAPPFPANTMLCDAKDSCCSSGSLQKVLTGLTNKGAVIFGEHLANLMCSNVIYNMDATIASINSSEEQKYAPELLITFGGHIVSKRSKEFFRRHKPKHHWHISSGGSMPDLFQSLTSVIEAEAEPFLAELLRLTDASKEYINLWQKTSTVAKEKVQECVSKAPFSDIVATQLFIKSLPKNSSLHLANSSSVRNALSFPLPSSLPVYCNRGINGIEGSLSTVVGYATQSENLVFSLIGDLSFFYDANALWNNHVSKKLRILLINNGGGGIFYNLPSLKSAPHISAIAGSHTASAKELCTIHNMKYLFADSLDTFEKQLPLFTTDDTTQLDEATVFEVQVSQESCKQAFVTVF